MADSRLGSGTGRMVLPFAGKGGKVICVNFTVRVIVIASLATSSLGGKLVAYRPNPQKYLVWPSVFLHLKNSFRKGKKKKILYKF